MNNSVSGHDDRLTKIIAWVGGISSVVISSLLIAAIVGLANVAKSMVGLEIQVRAQNDANIVFRQEMSSRMNRVEDEVNKANVRLALIEERQKGAIR